MSDFHEIARFALALLGARTQRITSPSPVCFMLGRLRRRRLPGYLMPTRLRMSLSKRTKKPHRASGPCRRIKLQTFCSRCRSQEATAASAEHAKTRQPMNGTCYSHSTGASTVFAMMATCISRETATAFLLQPANAQLTKMSTMLRNRQHKKTSRQETVPRCILCPITDICPCRAAWAV